MADKIDNSEAGEFVRVGKVKDAHGIKGELFVVLFAGEAAWIDQLKSLRLVSVTVPEQVKTFAIKSVRLHKNGLIAKTEGIKDRNEAETLKGWLMEIPKDYLISKEGEKIFLKEIEGFRVFTKQKGEIGKIVGFGTNGVQDLLVVRTTWGDFEIPFVEDFVDTLNFDNGELHLDLPLGLLGELDNEADDAGASQESGDDDLDDEQ